MLVGWGVQDESLTGVTAMFVYDMLIAKCFLVFGNPAWVNGIDCACDDAEGQKVSTGGVPCLRLRNALWSSR